MGVIAEGVKTVLQKNILYKLVCYEIKGFEFSRPPESTLLKVLSDCRQKAFRMSLFGCHFPYFKYILFVFSLGRPQRGLFLCHFWTLPSPCRQFL